MYKKDSLIHLNYGTISRFIYIAVYLAKTERIKEKIATTEPTRI
jgi:hypothetical protein